MSRVTGSGYARLANYTIVRNTTAQSQLGHNSRTHIYTLRRVAWSAERVRSTHSHTKYMRARLMVTYNISRLKAEIDQPGGCNLAGGGRGGRGDVTSASESEPDDLSEFGTLSCALIASLSPSLELEAGLWRGLNRCGQGKT